MPEGSSGSQFCYLWPFPESCTWGPKWNWNSWIPQLGQLYWPSHPHSLLHFYFYHKSFQTTRLTAHCYPISWDTSCYIELPLFFPFCLSSPFFPLNLQSNSLGNSTSMVLDFFLWIWERRTWRHLIQWKLWVTMSISWVKSPHKSQGSFCWSQKDLKTSSQQSNSYLQHTYVV